MVAGTISDDNFLFGAVVLFFGYRRLVGLIRRFLDRFFRFLSDFRWFFCVTGIIYDVIVEPPSVGSTTDEHGHVRPVAFMPNRVNGQYIMEGLASSFLFSLGGLGFIILDRTHNPSTPKLNRILLISVAFLCILVSFFTTWIFMRMKLPGYLQN